LLGLLLIRSLILRNFRAAGADPAEPFRQRAIAPVQTTDDIFCKSDLKCKYE
jgi:hypothetical protein